MKLVAPERVGMNGDSLSHIGTLLRERYIKPGKIAGSSTLVARGGKLCYFEQEGLMDRERGTLMRADTIFRIYSMTKPVTSIALMQLFEQGRFALTDPVGRYIPELANMRLWKAGRYPNFETVPSERPIEIRDLLMHTAGFTYDFLQQSNVDAAYGKLKLGWPTPGNTLKEMIGQLAELPLLFIPGSRWNYSVATDVVGYLVEVLSGMSLDDYFKKYIFGPLGMVDTGFEIPAANQERFAACYERRADKSVVLQDDPQKSHYRERSFLSGGGGLVSTMSDYYRFCQMLLAGGSLEGVRIIGRKTLEFMAQNHLPGSADLGDFATGGFSETAYEGIGFGLGFAVKDNAVKNASSGSNGQYFWGGLASTLFWIDPKEDLIAIFMTQLIPSSTYNFRGQLEAIIYGAVDGGAQPYG